MCEEYIFHSSLLLLLLVILHQMYTQQVRPYTKIYISLDEEVYNICICIMWYLRKPAEIWSVVISFKRWRQQMWLMKTDEDYKTKGRWNPISKVIDYICLVCFKVFIAYALLVLECVFILAWRIWGFLQGCRGSFLLWKGFKSHWRPFSWLHSRIDKLSRNFIHGWRGIPAYFYSLTRFRSERWLLQWFAMSEIYFSTFMLQGWNIGF